MRKKLLAVMAVLVLSFQMNSVVFSQYADAPLKVVFIRHGEKPRKGNNLTCEGFNRSLQLSNVLYKKFGVPTNLYVSALGLGSETKHCRMFETIIPFAVKYNIPISTKFEEKDTSGIATEILKEKGVVMVVWEHKAIAGIVNALGIKEELKWPDEDFDSIWIVTFDKGTAVLTTDKEGIVPSTVCPF